MTDQRAASRDRGGPGEFRIGSRTVRVSECFDIYWRFAAERQRIFHRRAAGQPPPWTSDPILSRHKFTNVYRAADRVSQYLISDVIYTGLQDADELVFRILLFKVFNRIETWRLLTDRLGAPPTWKNYDFRAYDKVLREAMEQGERIYSAAYIVPNPLFGETRKHGNHLRLIESALTGGLPEAVAGADDLRTIYHALSALPSRRPGGSPLPAPGPSDDPAPAPRHPPRFPAWVARIRDTDRPPGLSCSTGSTGRPPSSSRQSEGSSLAERAARDAEAGDLGNGGRSSEDSPRVNRMAFPHSVEQAPVAVSALATAARGCPAMDRTRRLAEWVGEGRELTASGVPKPAATVEVCGLLDIELPSGKKPRSALDVPELMAIWKTAIAAEFIEIVERRVRAGAGLCAWDSADADSVLRVWARSTIEGAELAGAEEGESLDGPVCLILLHGLYERAGVATLDDLAATRRDPSGIAATTDQPCPSCGRLHSTTDPFDFLGLGLGFDDAEIFADAGRTLEEFGAVTLHDRTAELTPLGRMLTTVLFRESAPGPETDVSALVGTLAGLPPEIATTMARPWLDGRPLTERVGELLTFAESANGQDRLAALTLAQSAGDDDAIAPAWRAWRARPGFGAYARQWLAAHGESVAIQPADEGWLAADALATMFSALPPDLPMPLLTAMMQADLGADAAEVLPLLRASGHPAADELVRLLGGTDQGIGRRGATTRRTGNKKSSRPASSTAYQLKISLRGVSKPPVWRRVVVPDAIRLDELHEVIQRAMGWDDGHLHVFSQGWTEYGTPDPELGHQNERGVSLSDLLAGSGDKLRYTYDFGDGWEHDILLERSVPFEPGARYPRCLTGKGACPPEDCGGVWGYADLKEIIADSAHEDHDDMLEWLGLDSAGDFDPTSFSVDDVNARLEHLR